MTVSTSVYKAGPYAGSGTTGPFTVNFRFLANSHLRVIKTSTTGSEATLTLGVDYSVTGAGGASGTVTLTSPLLTGEKLTIVRNVPLTQETDYVVDDSFPAESHEQALDKLTMIAQQLAEEVDRAVKVLPSSTDDPDALIASIKTSEQNAAASAASAAASYDLFDDRYLGSKTSNPTVDNDGNALQVGAEYWNSVSNERRTWNGSAWVSSITVVPDESVTTAKLADGAVTTAKWASSNGQLAGFRNRIINGTMAIDQRNRGSTQTFTAGAALAYCVDRWYGYCTGGNVTGRRFGTITNLYNYVFTGAAGTTKIGFAQRIEAANSQDLAGTTATLSVDLANSLLATVTWSAFYANTTDVFGSLSAPNRTQFAIGTFTVTSTLTRYSTQISIPAAATTGIEIELSVGAQTSGTWTIGRVQFEPGASNTPFEHRFLNGIELPLCQVYYIRYTGNGIQLANGHLNSATEYEAMVNFPVTMRATPAANALNVSNIQIRLAGGTTQFITNVSQFFGSGGSSIIVRGGMPSAGAVGQGCFLFSGNNDSGFEFSSEL